MRPTTQRRRLVGRQLTAALALTSLLGLAACGSETDSAKSGSTKSDSAEKPSASSSGSGFSTDKIATTPWLVRLETPRGEDEVSLDVTYVYVVPQTGKTHTTTLPVPISDYTSVPELLVDASHTWAIAANQLQSGEKTKAVLHNLIGEKDITLDLTTIQKNAIGWAFSPTEPGKLLVLGANGERATYDLATEKVVKQATPRVMDGYKVVPAFDPATGQPRMLNTKTGELTKAGKYQAEGGVSQVAEEAPCRSEFGDKLPAAQFVSDSGETTVVCLKGGRNLAFQAAESAKGPWKKVGEVAKGVAPKRTGTISWIYPV